MWIQPDKKHFFLAEHSIILKVIYTLNS